VNFDGTAGVSLPCQDDHEDLDGALILHVVGADQVENLDGRVGGTLGVQELGVMDPDRRQPPRRLQ
jgi:hypothetical protein